MQPAFPPPEVSAVAAAAHWIENILLGSAATAIGVLAVAGIGFAMLQGRFPARRGMQVAVGLFILFGARVISSGLSGLGGTDFAAPDIPAGQIILAPPTYTIPHPRIPEPAINHSPFDPSPAQGSDR